MSTPVDEDPAGRGPLEACEHAQQRRLAAPRRAQQAEDLLLVDAERDVIHGDEVAELLGDFLDPHVRLGVRVRPGLEFLLGRSR
ncbi:MAG: hypothetical protein V9E93_12070 [Steroidobacteraceae bacterium]